MSVSASRTIIVEAFDGYPLRCLQRQAEKPRALVVLLHGLVSHSAWLESVAEGLSRDGISCLSADRRGAGLNEKGRGDAPDAATLLSDLSAVLIRARDTGLPCHLAGFCWGANYVVNYMASDERPTHGIEVQTLSLLAPSLFPSARITDQPFETGDSFVADQTPLMPIECFTDGPMFDTFIVPDPLRLTHVSLRMNRIMADFSRGIWMKFLRLKAPTLVILGEDDEVVDNRATAQLFDRLRCSRKAFRTLPGKHGLQFDVPDDVVRLVSQWVLAPSEHTSGQTTGR